MKLESHSQTSQHLVGWAEPFLLKCSWKTTRSAPGLGHNAGSSQLQRKIALAVEFNKTFSVANRGGLVLI